MDFTKNPGNLLRKLKFSAKVVKSLTLSICFIQEETTYGPFFTSRGRAEQYLKDRGLGEKNMSLAMAGRNPYINVVSVVLNDEKVSFDG